ncbi:MAG: tetratricopeptide repeat protein, partial [Sideroxyarcus sp.]
MLNWFKKTPPSPASAVVPGNVASTKSAVPSEYAAHRKRGNEFLAQGRLKEAAECYRQAIIANPGQAEGLLNLGFVSGELG